MTKRDIYINRIILFSINREFSLKKSVCPMGWDGIFKKIFVPWDGTMFKIFRPIPSHGTEFSEKRPMGWDGMGWDYPIPRGALVLIIH
jgi:hypothetical protein